MGPHAPVMSGRMVLPVQDNVFQHQVAIGFDQHCLPEWITLPTAHSIRWYVELTVSAFDVRVAEQQQTRCTMWSYC